MKTVVILLKDNLFDGMSGRSWIWEKERGEEVVENKDEQDQRKGKVETEEQSKDGNEGEEFDE